MTTDVVKAGLQIAGYAYGGSWGYLAASILGNVLFPEELPDVRNVGPRLDDLRVQSSAFGRAIPRVYGKVRLAGNIIWSSPLIEVATTTEEEVGGKGGPSQTVSSTTYAYYADFALALCEGEIAGIARIWMNGELVYDVSSGAPFANVIGSNERWSSVTLYTGSETQAASELVESYEGAGNVPAYLGVAYVTFDHLDVTAWRAIPQIECEVIKAGTNAPSSTFFDGFETSTVAIVSVVYVATTGDVWASDKESTPISIKVVAAATGVMTEILFPGSPTGYNVGPYLTFDDEHGLMWVSFNSGTTYRVAAYDVATKEPRYLWASAYSENGSITSVRGVSENYTLVRHNALMRVVQWGASGVDTIGLGIYTGLGPGDDYNAARYNDAGVGVDAQWFWLSGRGGASPHVAMASYASFNSWVMPVGVDYIQLRPTIIQSRSKFYFVGVTAGVYSLYSFDLVSNAFTSIATSANYLAHELLYAEDVDRLLLTRRTSPTSATVRVVNPDTGAIETTYTVATPSSPTDYSPGLAASESSYAAGGVLFTAAKLAIQAIRLNTLTETTETLDSVVLSESELVGLDAGEMDVTALSAVNVRGYAVASLSTGRQAIEPLMTAYAFDLVESDKKMKAVLRGGTSVATFTEDDIGAVRAGTKPTTGIRGTRMQELELPKEVRVTYIDQASNYEQAVQFDRRLSGSASNTVEMQLPLVLSADEAKQIATRALYFAWANRVPVEWSSSCEFAHIEPTDIVTITVGNASYTVRVDDKRDDGVTIQWQGVTEDSAIYSQDGSGVSLPAPIATLSGLVPTTLVVMDIPLLRAQDDNVGVYVAAAGVAANWHGCELWISRDGTNYARAGISITNESAIGVATTALPTFLGGGGTDTLSQVTVAFNAGTDALASISEDAFRRGERGMLIGSELVYLRDLELVSGTTYTARVFRRERAGTSGAAHVAGDRVVLLEPGTVKRLSLAASDVGGVIYLKAVSYGRTLAQTAAQVLTFANVGKKPLAPIRLRGGRNLTTTDWVVDWVRRSRLAAGWNNYVDTPVGEASQLFDIEFYTSSAFTTLARTVTGNTTETYTYTAALQVTDFGSVRTTLYVRVYQFSAEYGRGDYVQGTLT